MAKGYLVYAKSKGGRKLYMRDKKTGTRIPLGSKKSADSLKKRIRKSLKKAGSNNKAGWKVYSKVV